MIDQFRRLIYKTRFHLPRSPLSQLLFRSLNPVVAAMIIGIHQAYWKRTGLCIINLVSTLYQYLRSPPTLVFFLWVKEEENGTYIWAPTQGNFLSVLQRMEPHTCYAMQPSLSRNPPCDTGLIAARKNSILRKLVKRLCS